MKILYMGNNWIGWKILEWLVQQGEEIVGLVVHPPSKRKFVDEMLSEIHLPQDRIFDASTLQLPETRQAIASLQPDIALSMLFGYILRDEFIRLFPKGVINLHPSFLPYNRGQYPNVWSILEGTPAGTTIHFIDAGIDTGDIIAQKQVDIEPIDTGKTLYHKLERASVELFRETWPSIRSGNNPRWRQTGESGTFHRTKDVQKIDRIDLDKQYKARDLIDRIRARTFAPYQGVFFEENGKRIYLRLELEYGEDE